MKSKLAIATELARAAGYNEEGKAHFKRFALNVLRGIARDLALPKETYSIRFNAGGIAVSGDAILHHDRFYLTMGEMGVMWRTCKGQKDYTGGANRWACSRFFAGFETSTRTVPELVEEIRATLVDARVTAS